MDPNIKKLQLLSHFKLSVCPTSMDKGHRYTITLGMEKARVIDTITLGESKEFLLLLV